MSATSAGTFSFEMKVGSGEASRKFRAGASNVRDEAGRYLGNVVLIEDVTEQLKLEEDLRAHSRKILRMSETIERNREEMAQREKMVAIGTMAAGVAHEIGNPLAAISAVVQRMMASAEKTDAQAEQLQSMAGQIDRIVAIVRGMLTFARPANGQRSLGDVDKLIEDTISIVRYSRHARNIRIESIRNMSLPKIEIMAQQFQQVLVNVLLNAFDAMENSAREKVVSIKRTVGQGWIDIKVTDNGCGMTQQQIGQAFEPFYTTKVPGRGTGLGLAVSYGLVEQQGGHIRITSTPGHGTTVTILLPGDRGAARNAGATGKVARKSARSASERES